MPMARRYSPYLTIAQVPGRCLFVGSNVDHNVYGLRWFLKDIWPKIVRQVPHCRLHVCGSVCQEIHKEFPYMNFLGRVDDLEPEYAAAEVCLIPLVVGSGLKIKLVEALSHGRACVSTSVGVQGVRELTNKAVLVADTVEGFAEAVITVLTNPEKRKEMEDLARKYVEENLSPEKVYQPLVDRIYQHISEI
jgi:glycosyltransferase involved in cell wall biosynthesis